MIKVVKRKIVAPRTRSGVAFGAHIITRNGCAQHAWRMRGGDWKGTGRRSQARKWKPGESGKQNKAVAPLNGFSKNSVSTVTPFILHIYLSVASIQNTSDFLNCFFLH